jgi:hypothetical protein
MREIDDAARDDVEPNGGGEADGFFETRFGVAQIVDALLAFDVDDERGLPRVARVTGSVA